MFEFWTVQIRAMFPLIKKNNSDEMLPTSSAPLYCILLICFMFYGELLPTACFESVYFCLCSNKTATKVIWSPGVYVATSSREIKTFQSDGV